MDRYITLGEPEALIRNGVQYTVQRYQGEHENEYLLCAPYGVNYLYENNVLKQQWQENEKGIKSEEFIAYKNGRVDFRQRFEDILEQQDFCRIVNHKKGLRMEIWSAKTGHMMYHGETNEKRQKEGWGIEYNEESGKMVLEGIWCKGELIEVIRLFNEDLMTELKRNGKDSLDPVKRIPLYVGGFRYDEDTETFTREGKGCLIDEETGIATRECEWKDGREVSGVDLNDGWYNLQLKPVFNELSKPEVAHPSKCVTITKSVELSNLSLKVTDLVISSNCCNELSLLDLKKFKWLQSIEIGNDCFMKVKTFQIDGLKRLKSLKIGINSFTHGKKPEWILSRIIDVASESDGSKSFHILNCQSLESIIIRENSFTDFAGQFELNNLPSLQSIQIGSINTWSMNFFYSSFEIGGN